MTVIDLLPIIWLITILAAIFCEALTERLIAVWFAPSAAIALILNAFDAAEYIQVIVFSSSAVVMIVSAKLIKAISRHREDIIHRHKE